MPPQVVNASYNAGKNVITFPAAILQPPYFDVHGDDAANYGAIGAIIGHEMGHGFDDQGRRSDGHGLLRDWWTNADAEAYQQRAARLVAQFDGYQALPGFNVNGKLTLGENIGDLTGVAIALRAYQRSLGGKPAPILDGKTGEQRFFIAWARAWREKQRDDMTKKQVASDPHSPSAFRANGPLGHIPEFYEAFNVKPGDGMYIEPQRRVKIF
jgi:endothelin-converting enzyme/putative endopeptidase